jgi:hypothetical protein
MHWGIYFIMGISFKYYLWGLAYASFFPLERLGAVLRLTSLREWLGMGIPRFTLSRSQ